MTRGAVARFVLSFSALALGACGSNDTATATRETPGNRLERAAVSAGLVIDPAKASLAGSWSLDTDRLCVVPAARDTFRLGALIDYGEGQGCAASGTARRRGDRIAVTFPGCRFDARFDGERIVFPAELPGGCDNLCTGRASLASLTVEHVSAAVSEAETLRTPSGRMLCAAPD